MNGALCEDKFAVNKNHIPCGQETSWETTYLVSQKEVNFGVSKKLSLTFIACKLHFNLNIDLKKNHFRLKRQTKKVFFLVTFSKCLPWLPDLHQLKIWVFCWLTVKAKGRVFFSKILIFKLQFYHLFVTVVLSSNFLVNSWKIVQGSFKKVWFK